MAASPQRVIPGGGDGGSVGIAKSIQDLRRTARNYLERRSLARPAIPWQDLRRIKDSAVSSPR